MHAFTDGDNQRIRALPSGIASGLSIDRGSPFNENVVSSLIAYSSFEAVWISLACVDEARVCVGVDSSHQGFSLTKRHFTRGIGDYGIYQLSYH